MNRNCIHQPVNQVHFPLPRLTRYQPLFTCFSVNGIHSIRKNSKSNPSGNSRFRACTNIRYMDIEKTMLSIVFLSQGRTPKNRWIKKKKTIDAGRKPIISIRTTNIAIVTVARTSLLVVPSLFGSCFSSLSSFLCRIR